MIFLTECQSEVVSIHFNSEIHGSDLCKETR
jgi:hypothetical protein